MTSDQLSICFVCQKGRLEVQSMMLAASLRGKLPQNTLVKVGIPLPERVFSEPDKRTLDFFESLSIEPVVFTNAILKDENIYPGDHHMFANKIFLLKEMSNVAEQVLFIDSDHIAYAPFHTSPWGNVMISMRSANGWTHVSTMVPWQKPLFEKANIDFPNAEVAWRDPNDSDNVIMGFQDFATSFIAIKGNAVDAFCDKWLELFSIANGFDMQKKFHLEELAFSAAVYGLGLHYAEFRQPFDSFLFNYTNVYGLRENQSAQDEIASILKEFPYISQRAKELDCFHVIEKICLDGVPA